jgi:Family of unknown function (DUF5996)
MSEIEKYPALPLDEWKETNDTVHLWTQIVGKIRLTQTPLLNQWWNVPLYVTARGLTTSVMPCDDKNFSIDFDFLSHKLIVQTNFNDGFSFDLEPISVADFYFKLLPKLRANEIEVEIHGVPDELENPIPFVEDHEHKSYDKEAVERFFRVISSVDRVFKEFRARFTGKSSPVHFFWGSFDLAVTRFCGREAPPRENADRITRIAYDQEVISHGFWTGNGFGEPAFYAYHAPEPQGFKDAKIKPDEAFYSKEMSEYFLKYEDVRNSENPDQAILDFIQTTYEAGAKSADWNDDKLRFDWSEKLK